MAGGAPSHERTGVGFDRQTQQATVTKVVELSCQSVNASGGVPTGDTSTAEGSSAVQQAKGDCKRATIRVDTGDDKGRTFEEIVQPDQSRQLHEGQQVVVAYEPSAPKDLQYSVTDINRRLPWPCSPASSPSPSWSWDGCADSWRWSRLPSASCS